MYSITRKNFPTTSKELFKKTCKKRNKKFKELDKEIREVKNKKRVFNKISECRNRS